MSQEYNQPSHWVGDLAVTRSTSSKKNELSSMSFQLINVEYALLLSRFRPAQVAAYLQNSLQMRVNANKASDMHGHNRRELMAMPSLETVQKQLQWLSKQLWTDHQRLLNECHYTTKAVKSLQPTPQAQTKDKELSFSEIAASLLTDESSLHQGSSSLAPPERVQRLSVNRHRKQADDYLQSLVIDWLKLNGSVHSNALSNDQYTARLAEHALLKLINVVEEDYMAYFEIAWLNLFFLDNYAKAEQYFEIAVQFSEKKSPLFARFAKRHLAFVYYKQQEYVIAANTMLDILNEQLYPNPEYQYEYARYLAMAGDHELSKIYLEQVTEKLPIYLLLAQMENDFLKIQDLGDFIQQYRAETMFQICQETYRQWYACRLAKLSLPDDIDCSRVFEDTLKAQQTHIQKQSLVVVKQQENALPKNVIHLVQTKLINTLEHKEKACLQEIESKKSKWRGVNKIGGFLLHAAAVLLLAVLFVLMAKFIIITLGWGNTFRFDETVGQVFILVLALGGVGSYLFQSQPLGMKKLFKQTYRFQSAIVDVRQGAGNH